MVLFKSNGRYKLFNEGYHYIMEFRWRNIDDNQLFIRITEELTEMHGPDRIRDSNARKVTFNENWRREVVRSAKRKRIYLRNESDASMIMLKV